MANFRDQYDAAFLGILQNEGKIVGFLDAIFSFLFRRTDFYVELTSKTDKMGFPPGVSEKLLLQAFKKYEKAAQQQRALHKKQQQMAKASEMDVTTANTSPSAKTNKTDVSSKQPTPMQGADSHADILPADTASLTSHDSDTRSCSQVKAEPGQLSSETAKQSNNDTDKVINKNASGDSSISTNAAATKPDEEDGDKSTLASQQKLFQADPDSYNGAVRDKYSWSQSITDLDIKIFVPDNIRKGKDVQVDVQRKHICARCKMASSEWQTLVEGDLTWEVNKEESMWSLEPGKSILLNLEKVQERWWECILIDEPKINVQNIEPSRPMSDLDDEAQCKIEEMMYNERQKKLGLPQSHEQKMNDMLKKAWDVEGSPFQGQPFDPSKLNITPPGTMDFSPQ